MPGNELKVLVNWKLGDVITIYDNEICYILLDDSTSGVVILPVSLLNLIYPKLILNFWSPVERPEINTKTS